MLTKKHIEECGCVTQALTIPSGVDDVDDHDSYKEVMPSMDTSKWHRAIKQEMQSLDPNKI